MNTDSLKVIQLITALVTLYYTVFLVIFLIKPASYKNPNCKLRINSKILLCMYVYIHTHRQKGFFFLYHVDCNLATET